MIRGLYMAGGALVQEAYNLEVVANNVANINTVGYKADRAAFHSFEEVLLGRTNERPGSRNVGPLLRSSQIDGLRLDLSQGALTPSGNPLDLGIKGPGFFGLQNPDGSLSYTRAGNFALSPTRQLITATGQAVLDDQGQPITIPDGGALAIDARGSMNVGPLPIARLGVHNFTDITQLEKEGGNAFRDKGGAGPVPVAGNTSVQQGFLERSNVSALAAMGELTMVLRTFEASQKIVTMMDETLRQAATDLGRTQ